MFSELPRLGCVPHVVTNDDGSRTTFCCIGSLAFRLHYLFREEAGPAPVRISVHHAEWDSETPVVDMSEQLDHHDITRLATILPSLAKLTAVARGNRLSIALLDNRCGASKGGTCVRQQFIAPES